MKCTNYVCEKLRTAETRSSFKADASPSDVGASRLFSNISFRFEPWTLEINRKKIVKRVCVCVRGREGSLGHANAPAWLAAWGHLWRIDWRLQDFVQVTERIPCHVALVKCTPFPSFLKRDINTWNTSWFGMWRGANIHKQTCTTSSPDSMCMGVDISSNIEVDNSSNVRDVKTTRYKHKHTQNTHEH